MSEDEVKRRESVALARKMGTEIRKETLKRQALTAKINLPYVKKAVKEFEELFKRFDKIFPPKFSKTIAGKKEEEIARIINEMIDPVKTLQLQMLQKDAERIVKEINESIQVYNKIIGELNKEGMRSIIMSELPDNSDYIDLKRAREGLKLIIRVYQDLIRYEKL